MNKKKIIWLFVALLLTIAAIFDAMRYLKPDAEAKMVIQPANHFPISNANEMVLVYNAWGGIYPGLVDFVHKEFFSKTYPCNLCQQTFGTFQMKDEWRRFIDSLPLKKSELHKENFQRMYQPEDLQLPVILISNGKEVQLLLSASELNQYKSLKELISSARTKLEAVE